MNVCTKFEVCSFTRSWDNRGTQKILAVPGYAHASSSPKLLKGFSLDASYECTGLPNLKSVALPFLKLIGGSPKIWGGPWLPTLYPPQKIL